MTFVITPANMIFVICAKFIFALYWLYVKYCNPSRLPTRSPGCRDRDHPVQRPGPITVMEECMTEERKKITLPYLFDKVSKAEPITWLTCYDYPTAYLQEQAGIEMILVGDSLGMTMLGFDSTLPVTMADMIRHTTRPPSRAPS
jgi:hypothetical protein